MNGGNPQGVLPRPFTSPTPGKARRRQWPHHGTVIRAAEPDDDQIVLAQVRHLAGRRDEFHRFGPAFFAQAGCKPFAQAGYKPEIILLLISGTSPVNRPASAIIAVIADLPSLGDEPGDSCLSPGQEAGLTGSPIGSVGIFSG